MACIIYLKNYTAMPFQNIVFWFGTRRPELGTGGPGRVADILLFTPGAGIAHSPRSFMFLELTPVATSISSLGAGSILVGASTCTRLSSEEGNEFGVQTAAQG